MSKSDQVNKYISNKYFQCSARLVNTYMETESNLTPKIEAILELLEHFDELIDDTPPLWHGFLLWLQLEDSLTFCNSEKILNLVKNPFKQPFEPGIVSFGNRAITSCFEKEEKLIEEAMPIILGEELAAAVPKVGVYFAGRFLQKSSKIKK